MDIMFKNRLFGSDYGHEIVIYARVSTKKELR